jgi:hypothetical protein
MRIELDDKIAAIHRQKCLAAGLSETAAFFAPRPRGRPLAKRDKAGRTKHLAILNGLRNEMLALIEAGNDEWIVIAKFADDPRILYHSDDKKEREKFLLNLLIGRPDLRS